MTRELCANDSKRKMIAMRLRAVVIAAVLVSAACSDDGASSASTTTVPRVTPVTTARAAATGAAASRAPRCDDDDLDISLGPVGAGLGHWGTRVVFRNTGAAACELTGYPEVAGLTTQGRKVEPAKRTPNGYIGWDTAEPPAVVRLAPSDEASAVIEGTNVPQGGAMNCPSYRTIRVSAPNATKPKEFDGPWNNCSGIEVHPLVAGATGKQSRDDQSGD